MPKAWGNSQRRLNRTTRRDPPQLYIYITQQNSSKGRETGGRVKKFAFVQARRIMTRYEAELL